MKNVETSRRGECRRRDNPGRFQIFCANESGRDSATREVQRCNYLKQQSRKWKSGLNREPPEARWIFERLSQLEKFSKGFPSGPANSNADQKSNVTVELLVFFSPPVFFLVPRFSFRAEKLAHMCVCDTLAFNLRCFICHRNTRAACIERIDGKDSCYAFEDDCKNVWNEWKVSLKIMSHGSQVANVLSAQ